MNTPIYPSAAVLEPDPIDDFIPRINEHLSPPWTAGEFRRVFVIKHPGLKGGHRPGPIQDAIDRVEAAYRSVGWAIGYYIPADGSCDVVWTVGRPLSLTNDWRHPPRRETKENK